MSESVARYVVQTSPSMQKEGEEGRRWVDVATINVPARTHRKTVIRQALEHAGITPNPGDEALLVRALSAESAEEVRVRSVQAPPELQIVSP